MTAQRGDKERSNIVNCPGCKKAVRYDAPACCDQPPRYGNACPLWEKGAGEALLKEQSKAPLTNALKAKWSRKGGNRNGCDAPPEAMEAYALAEQLEHELTEWRAQGYTPIAARSATLASEPTPAVGTLLAFLDGGFDADDIIPSSIAKQAAADIRVLLKGATPPEAAGKFQAIGYYHRGAVMWEPMLRPVEDGLIYVSAVAQHTGPSRT